MNLFIPAIQTKINATVSVPSSKSIGNRVLLMAAIAKGTSIIYNVNHEAEDIVVMLNCLKKLGIPMLQNGSTFTIVGCNKNIPIKNADLYVANSGTTMRFLSSVLALSDGIYKIIGSDRMSQRPSSDMFDSLKQLGANIITLPLTIMPFIDKHLSSVKINSSVSSQYLSGLLIASIMLNRKAVIFCDELISKPYVDITTNLMQKFNADIVVKNNKYSVSGNYLGTEYTVESDASSASYFFAIAALNGRVTVENINKNTIQGDIKFLDVLRQTGAIVCYNENSITVESNTINAIHINMNDMPDVALTLAVLALFATGTTHISGIASWKVKECDRIVAMSNELRKCGSTVVYTNDTMQITPPNQFPNHVTIDTYNDHRIAMSFSLLPFAGINVTINNSECSNKTFPKYFDILINIIKY